jgi:hypothetical protein
VERCCVLLPNAILQKAATVTPHRRNSIKVCGVQLPVQNGSKPQLRGYASLTQEHRRHSFDSKVRTGV